MRLWILYLIHKNNYNFASTFMEICFIVYSQSNNRKKPLRPKKFFKSSSSKIKRKQIFKLSLVKQKYKLKPKKICKSISKISHERRNRQKIVNPWLSLLSVYFYPSFQDIIFRLFWPVYCAFLLGRPWALKLFNFLTIVVHFCS